MSKIVTNIGNYIFPYFITNRDIKVKVLFALIESVWTILDSVL